MMSEILLSQIVDVFPCVKASLTVNIPISVNYVILRTGEEGRQKRPKTACALHGRPLVR